MRLRLFSGDFSDARRWVPWIRFGAVLLPVLAVLWAEVREVERTRSLVEMEVLAVSGLELLNERHEEASLGARERMEGLKAATDGVLGGLLLEGQEEPEVGVLTEVGLQERAVTAGVEEVRIKLMRSALEYHALVPALGRQEAETPLMRCTWMSLKTTGRPFHTSATPLQVDLELAFPRSSAGFPATNLNTVPK